MVDGLDAESVIPCAWLTAWMLNQFFPCAGHTGKKSMNTEISQGFGQDHLTEKEIFAAKNKHDLVHWRSPLTLLQDKQDVERRFSGSNSWAWLMILDVCDKKTEFCPVFSPVWDTLPGGFPLDSVSLIYHFQRHF